jgi:hypothetical protein
MSLAGFVITDPPQKLYPYGFGGAPHRFGGGGGVRVVVVVGGGVAGGLVVVWAVVGAVVRAAPLGGGVGVAASAVPIWFVLVVVGVVA